MRDWRNVIEGDAVRTWLYDLTFMLLCYGLVTTFENTHIHNHFIPEHSSKISMLRFTSAFVKGLYCKYSMLVKGCINAI
jgi:hypothetical protein